MQECRKWLTSAIIAAGFVVGGELEGLASVYSGGSASLFAGQVFVGGLTGYFISISHAEWYCPGIKDPTAGPA